MLTPQNVPFRHRRRTKRMPLVNKGELISYHHAKWGLLEEKVLLEITNKDQEAVSLLCMKHGLNPTDFCDKWLKLLRTIDGSGLAELLRKCKEGYKSGLSFPEIGKIVRLRRGSVKNILKGYVNLDRSAIIPRTVAIIGLPECFDLDMFTVNTPLETSSKENVVQQFAHFRVLQVEEWMEEKNKGLIARGKQVLLMKFMDKFGVDRVEEACAQLDIPEALYECLWAPLVKQLGERLPALVQVVIQLILLGYTVATVTFKLSLEESVVPDICFNFTLQNTDMESLLASFFQLVATEPDLHSLCEECNFPYKSALRLRERWQVRMERSDLVTDRGVWWLYQNGVDVPLIERCFGVSLRDQLCS